VIDADLGVSGGENAGLGHPAMKEKEFLC
jgi:hypothetical protein